MQIVVDDLSGPVIAAFLEEHVRHMRAITPLESKHALDLDALRRPEVTFWSVLDDQTLVGCGAIKRLDDTHAEVKSMRTAADRRAPASPPGCSRISSPRPSEKGSPGSASRPALPTRSSRPGDSMRSSASNTAAPSRTTGRIRSASS